MYRFAGLGLLILLVVVRSAHIRVPPSDQCNFRNVVNGIDMCVKETTAYEWLTRSALSGIDAPGTTTFDAIYVLNEFCLELPDIVECVQSAITFCEDSEQKRQIVQVFAAKSSICQAKSWIEPLLGTYSNDSLMNPGCGDTPDHMVRSCFEFELDTSEASLSEVIGMFNRMSNATVNCLVTTNYELVFPGCGSISPKAFAVYLAMLIHSTSIPGFALTTSQFQLIQQME